MANGSMGRLKAKESICGRTVIDMKVIGRTARSMARVLIYLRMEINIQELIKMVDRMAMVSINGKMVLFIPASLKKD